jgi:hypothetical protein
VVDCLQGNTGSKPSQLGPEKLKQVEMMDNDEEDEGDNGGESALGDFPLTIEPVSPSLTRRTKGHRIIQIAKAREHMRMVKEKSINDDAEMKRLTQIREAESWAMTPRK